MGIFGGAFRHVIGSDGTSHLEHEIAGMRIVMGGDGAVHNVMHGPGGYDTVMSAKGTHLEYNDPNSGMRTVFGPDGPKTEWKL